jgi:probable phosphoglycerate mutase
MTIHKPFYFLRHGETDWNHKRLYMGQTDIPLNQRGMEQAREAGKILAREPIKSIVTSPLIRAHQTAEIIAQYLTEEVTITVIDEMKECCWGKYEGAPIVGDGIIFEKWMVGEILEDAETITELESRVVSGLVQSLALPAPVLIVGHSGSYLAVQRYLSLPPTRIPNCVPIFHKAPQSLQDTWKAIILENTK